ncbi:flagellar hook-basal body complex protein FliE [Fontimonas thermophila]|uniref:Flagellar hook-basal body complex protein FliE n=1 Tax=Fontimonas thermophila TaxID=1076937 RepID=A0A1I2IT57_9GAMM|nr:flagellar hook-basal body complex protein FliE [Fontimonas thermophila]SFF43701.1 flagellar hook-basal body complex protein FliE [Fontimonas thermophila]
MSDMDVSRVLAQIRALQAQAALRPAAPGAAAAPPKTGFDDLLKKAIGQVNDSQQAAARLQEAFSRGERTVELADVMLASAKAQVNFKAMTEVRNRLVAAYQDIMNMPV